MKTTAKVSSGRVWIDVTDFLNWKGAFSGFQRIQFNMARQYEAAGRSVAYFVYQESTHAFREVPFNTQTVVKDGIVDAKEAAVARRTFKAVLKQLTPAPIKRVAKKVLRPAPSTTRASSGAHQTQSPFMHDDVVLVLGGIWHGSFADDMTSEKRAKQFTFVHIVHDMIPVVTPQYVVEDLPAVFATYKEKIFKIADGLIVNSKSSQKDALAFMADHHITPPPMTVFRIADEAVGESQEAVPELKKHDFLLAVSTIEGRKNHALLYYVYKQAARQGIVLPKMVIVGRNGWLTDDIRYMITHDPETKDQILLRNDVGNNELAWLFAHCLFTVCPSFYEGWGMPVAESLGYGKVCLSSDVSSMPEIAPQLLEFFSPYSTDECLRLIQKYLDKDTRVAREKRIKKEYKPTSWHDMFVRISSFIDTL